MTNDTTEIQKSRFFHAGEQAIQQRVGKHEEIESFASRAIRSSMPEQHRTFFHQLPFLVAGSVDDRGRPWASVVSGKPGFITTPDENTLRVAARPVAGDPLATALKPDSPLGLLGIEMQTRRRNRVNVHIEKVNAEGFVAKVDQSFGNCPQYIQTRSVDFVREPDAGHGESHRVNNIDQTIASMITSADTFFVASYVEAKENAVIEGVDVSHRGGKPGFVKVDGNTLTIPDYSGNFLFNTLGNFLVNPKAGLIFPDFTTGNLLTLTGAVEILWEDAPEVRAFHGAERAWRFTLDHGYLLLDALPFRSIFEEYSPNTLITGNWEQAAEAMEALEKSERWRPFRIVKTEDESSVIRSFYLTPEDGAGLAPFRAGQFLTLRAQSGHQSPSLIRTYTVSSAPEEPYFRISVKRENEGKMSTYLHDSMRVNDIVEVRSPAGDFFIDASVKRPAVLIAGGVGITPMMSMAQHVMNEGKRTRHVRSLTVFHASRSSSERAFYDVFRKLESQSSGMLRYYSIVSKVGQGEKAGINFNGSGRVTADLLSSALLLADYDFYLCGPAEFMQVTYDALRSLGVFDGRINAEAFGPASLIRDRDTVESTSIVEEAKQSLIHFSGSGFEQRWNAGESTILEIAEQHGLTPTFGCRNGACGSCAVKIVSGEVAYRKSPTAPYDADQALICCAVPASGSEFLELDM